MGFIVILVVLLIPSPVLSQPYSFFTNPSSEGRGESETQPIYVITEDGADVSLYCLVVNEGAGQDGEQIRTGWQSKRTVDSVFESVTFNSSGVSMSPVYFVGRIKVTGLPLGGGTFRTNFTLLNFTAEFNLISFRCGQLNEDAMFFTLGLPGKD